MKTHMIDRERSTEHTYGEDYLIWTECGLWIGFFSEFPDEDEVLMGENVIPNTQDPEKVTCQNCKKSL